MIGKETNVVGDYYRRECYKSTWGHGHRMTMYVKSTCFMASAFLPLDISASHGQANGFQDSLSRCNPSSQFLCHILSECELHKRRDSLRNKKLETKTHPTIRVCMLEMFGSGHPREDYLGQTQSHRIYDGVAKIKVHNLLKKGGGGRDRI